MMGFYKKAFRVFLNPAKYKVSLIRLTCLTNLFNSNADTHGVDGALYQHLLFVISADDDRLQQQLFAAPVTKYRRVESVNVESNSFMAASFVNVSLPESLTELLLQACYDVQLPERRNSLNIGRPEV